MVRNICLTTHPPLPLGVNESTSCMERNRKRDREKGGQRECVWKDTVNQITEWVWVSSYMCGEP